MLVESFSGVRGVFGESLTLDVAKRYASAFSRHLGPDAKIVVGMDTRPSSKQIAAVMMECLPFAFDLGCVSTPMCEHMVRVLGADGGIMITASHNEPNENGFKFLDASGGIVAPEIAEKLIADAKNPAVSVDGTVDVVDSERSLREYANFLRSTLGDRVQKIRDSAFTVVIDPNGGSACVYKRLLSEFGVTVIAKNSQPGVFVRKVEPNADTLAYLMEIVEENHAFVAAGFDCDADRVELMSRSGAVSGNYVLAMVVEEVLSDLEPRQIVVTNDATSGVVKEVATRFDGVVFESQVGEVNVVTLMEEKNAAVGGEGSSSGGIVPPSKCRDGLHSLLFVLALAARKGLSLEELLGSYPQYTSIRENLRLDPEIAKNAASRFKEEFADETIVENDSIKVMLEDGSWVWMRQSRTEAGVLRILADSKDEDTAKELLSRGVCAVNPSSSTT